VNYPVRNKQIEESRQRVSDAQRQFAAREEEHKQAEQKKTKRPKGGHVKAHF
jgi:hypothetical protein